MNNTELKPCPFCGREAKIVDDTTIMYIPQYQIRCKNISCTIRPKTNWCVDKSEAIRHWNTRKPMDNIVTELESRKELLNMAKISTTQKNVGQNAYNIAIDIVKSGGVE